MIKHVDDQSELLLLNHHAVELLCLGLVLRHPAEFDTFLFLGTGEEECACQDSHRPDSRSYHGYIHVAESLLCLSKVG